MSTTVGTLEKSVEKVFEKLTPAEKAKYVYEETWSIAERQSKGIDEESHQQDIERFFHRHVATLSAAGFIEFLITEDILNTGKWAGMYFASTLTAFDREDCLLDLLIDYAKLIKSLIVKKCAKTDKLNAEVPGMDELINGFQNRQAVILKEAKGIWKDELWERWNITRPDLSPELIETIEKDNELSEKAELKNS